MPERFDNLLVGVLVQIPEEPEAATQIGRLRLFAVKDNKRNLKIVMNTPSK